MSTPRKTKKRITPILCLLSDASGNLLEHVLSALLTQFPKKQFEIQTFPFLTTRESIQNCIRSIRQGIVFHGFAGKEFKDLVRKECSIRSLKCWDVTGPAADFLEKAAGFKISDSPKPIHRVDHSYLGRMEALEFAVQHDDSRRLEHLDQADIVLVGISRVSKSPTSLFLAYRGFRVANVSIVPSQGLPEALNRHPKKNVVALTIRPDKLSAIRRRRLSGWDIDESSYLDRRSVTGEVIAAEKLYRGKNWPLIDTTELAVEEISTKVLSFLRLKPRLIA